MTHVTQNENQAHHDTYGFLEQIAITDSKKQKSFFARHKLNFKNQPQVKKRNIILTNLATGICAIWAVALIISMISSYHHDRQPTIMMNLDKIDIDSSNYAPVVGRDYSVNNKAEQQKIVLGIRHLIANPIVDGKGHLYVDNTLIAGLLKDFYSISDSNKHLDYQAYFSLLDDMDSPFIDEHIKKEFAQKGMIAMQENYKTAILSRDYYLSHLPKWDFTPKASTQAYQDQFDDDYFTYHESFFNFFSKYATGVEYTLEQGNVEEQNFWKIVR